ncbi:hypothetical protein [Bacteroides sp.]|uniref:hypothetical protein n=1 Tax=Bacteroides sp. TaxID=29523 RepID=UPI00262E6CE9|nr:hypothetical protein [Bacteroides sp.]MDD3039732.1 hypothetical protein [Bacteroides sp.]
MTENRDYFDLLKERVLSHIPKGRNNAIPQRELCFQTQLKPRELKVVISSLRKHHPICSKETSGGGYWIAESKEEIFDFIKMLKARRAGYSKTISSMYGRAWELS